MRFLDIPVIKETFWLHEKKTQKNRHTTNLDICHGFRQITNVDLEDFTPCLNLACTINFLIITKAILLKLYTSFSMIHNSVIVSLCEFLNYPGLYLLSSIENGLSGLSYRKLLLVKFTCCRKFT
jgi:hypothetical protein